MPATEEAASPPEAAGASAAPAEEAFIEVWRPGRPEGARRERPRGQRRPPREPAQKPSGDAPRPAAAASAAAAPDEAAKTAERPQRPPRPARKPRSDRPPRPAREGGLFATSAPKERRDKAPDPNSPFAKLAALKEQLEANAKERR
jgi:ATP-dependent RNA helicase SUPV3L1/SUV3